MSDHHRFVIIGSGPAGYTAGVYAARAQLQPVIFAGEKSGGQLMSTTDIENYPGFKDGIAGPELMMVMRQQAERFGSVIHDKYVTAVDFSARPFKIWTTIPTGATGEVFEHATPAELAELQTQIRQTEPTITADTVVITTGAVSKKMGVPGEDRLLGRGLSTCAVCDAPFFRDKVTYVVGGGDSAMEDTLALVKFAKSVTVLHRRDHFRASKIMQDRVLKNPNVKVIWNTAVEEVIGDQKVEKIRINTNGQVSELPAEGIFVAVGHKPVSSIFAGQLQLDERGFIVTRQSGTKHGVAAAQAALAADGLLAFPTMTSVEGVFAGGDVVDVRYQQAITAAGQGCAAALDAERWLEMQ